LGTIAIMHGHLYNLRVSKIDSKTAQGQRIIQCEVESHLWVM
jgi:hypothetical protein